MLALGRDFTRFDLDGGDAGVRCERVPFDRVPLTISLRSANGSGHRRAGEQRAMLTAQPFGQYSPKDRRDLIATNIEAPAELIRCLVPPMIDPATVTQCAAVSSTSPRWPDLAGTRTSGTAPARAPSSI